MKSLTTISCKFSSSLKSFYSERAEQSPPQPGRLARAGGEGTAGIVEWAQTPQGSGCEGGWWFGSLPLLIHHPQHSHCWENKQLQHRLGKCSQDYSIPHSQLSTGLRITELFRFGKTFQIKSNHSPRTAKAITKPCPQVSHPHRNLHFRAPAK